MFYLLIFFLAPKVAAAVQQQVAVKNRMAKKDDSFPIISNVVSLAPQGTLVYTSYYIIIFIETKFYDAPS
jgi:hypothetical protein